MRRIVPQSRRTRAARELAWARTVDSLLGAGLNAHANSTPTPTVARTPPVGVTQVVERWTGAEWTQTRQRWDGERYLDLPVEDALEQARRLR